ncbi:MAG: hypothetical protein CL917_13635 [Deltaproteobacteria bacterium]|nr:hypothetical protein [Deltaproteobacteria bacterium]
METRVVQAALAKRLEEWAAEPGFSRLQELLQALAPVVFVASEWGRSAKDRDKTPRSLSGVLFDGSNKSGSALCGPLHPGLASARLSSQPSLLEPSDSLSDLEFKAAAGAWEECFHGRTLVVHNAEKWRSFLAQEPSLLSAPTLILDTRDLMMVTHPDAPDLELTSWRNLMDASSHGLDTQEDAMELLLVLSEIAERAEEGEVRYGHARDALERYVPDSPWLTLLPKSSGLDGSDPLIPQTVQISDSDEEPVPFEFEAIAAVLNDQARGDRYFPGYRVRDEQITLMRGFFETLSSGGTLLLEGGTGVGKSLAYLAAAIPFAMARAELGERDPIVISTRTKLLQDQLLEKDIAAAARMFGHPHLKALSIKGRANYVCEWRLQETLAAGSDEGLLLDDRMAHAALLSCARIRSGGEVGSLPGPMFHRRPLLRDLIQRSVARRAEQCSREQCGHQRRCPFGQRRQALAKADLIVANHDLLLRWPPDYPRFQHVIADEAHELAGVADEVYAQVVRPEELRERIDEVFGPASLGAGDRDSNPGLLAPELREAAAEEVKPIRRALAMDLAALGRSVSEQSSTYGAFELPANAAELFPQAVQMAELSAARLDELSRLAQSYEARMDRDSSDEGGGLEGLSPILRHAQSFSEAAVGLRRAFLETGVDAVASFDRLLAPHDHWTLAIRAVSPAQDFHENFMEGLESFSGVSASLFVGGDAFAAVGELEIEERSHFGVDKLVTPSPFNYSDHMRVAAIRSEPGNLDLVAETTAAIADLARLLNGRTMGLFSSLNRMKEVATRLDGILGPHQIEVLAPRRPGDDLAGLVRRFKARSGGTVLLGSRTFWQGLDIPGDDLQAVVIEKLPFEVPTELRRRRETHLSDMGENAFERYRLGKMLLNLKQMTGRLIRGESDRGLVVIVEGRTHQRYFGQLGSALPSEVDIQVVDRSSLAELLAELGLVRVDER